MRIAQWFLGKNDDFKLKMSALLPSPCCVYTTLALKGLIIYSHIIIHQVHYCFIFYNYSSSTLYCSLLVANSIVSNKLNRVVNLSLFPDNFFEMRTIFARLFSIHINFTKNQAKASSSCGLKCAFKFWWLLCTK